MKLETMRTWAEISLGNLEHNYRALRACAPDSKFLGVVKANAYGHGAVPVARKLEELGADYLAVACLNEAMELRQAGIRMPILILGATPEELAGLVVDYDVTQTVFTPGLAQALSQAAGVQGRRAKIHVKVDTGMSRLGLLDHDPAAAAREVEGLCALPNLEAEGIFTHFANADGDEAYTMLQFTRFLDTLAELEETYGRKFEIRHCAASGAVLNYPCTHLDMVRPGVALYGHAPDPSCAGLDEQDLRPAMTLKSRVAAVRDLPGDTPVSYGCTQRVGRNGGRVAVLPIGYADGLDRHLSRGAWSMLVNGRPAPIIGNICMDTCMLDITGIDAREGDPVTIFGAEPGNTVSDMAAVLKTIPYEIMTSISTRVKRVYTKE